MTLRELTKDIQLIASKSGITDDFRLRSRHVQFLIQKHRGIAINSQYERTRITDPSWLQYFGKVEFNRVETSDDPNVTVNGTYKLGKWLAPPILSMRDDVGFNRIATIGRIQRFAPVSIDRLMHILEAATEESNPLINPRAAFRYMARVGNQVYVYPFDDICKNGLNVQLILDDPLDGKIILTHWVESGDLKEGVVYRVVDNQISYNGIIYNPGDTFTGLPGVFDYQGQGHVKHDVEKRDMTQDDEYPMSIAIASEVAMGVLTQELGIEEKKIADIINDAQGQLKVISTGEST